jgi:phosphopentomutase
MLLNKLLEDSYKPFGAGECLDAFTNYGAFEYLKNKHPKVLYISYGETDEWAHEGKYASYLNAAHQLDKWLNDLWNYIQSVPQYKNKTTLFVTVDHGRGRGTHWTSHGRSIEGSNEIWFAMIGPDTPPKGEITTNTQLYQNQFAATWAMLLGLDFVCEHPVGKPINNNIF